MTATDRLRAMLDERGVEYEQADGWWTSWETEGVYSYGGVVYCEDLGSGLEIRWHTITPEQAIAATLGAGTCRLPETRTDHRSIEYNGTTSWRICSACGAEVLAYPVNYCPNCGGEVEG